MDRTSPEMVRMVEEELGRRMGSLLAYQDMATVGGVETLVEIINRSARPTERSILEWLESSDPELAERIRSQMFVFEDIVTIDDRSLQQVLREVEANELATALKGVRVDVRDKVVRNLSERAGENLLEEMDLLGPVRARTVEEAQAKVVAVIRTLEEQGVLTISRGGGPAGRRRVGRPGGPPPRRAPGLGTAGDRPGPRLGGRRAVHPLPRGGRGGRLPAQQHPLPPGPVPELGRCPPVGLRCDAPAPVVTQRTHRPVHGSA
jgi:hypothetical protein